MKMYVVRHANKMAGDFYSESLRHSDAPISNDGRANAQSLALYLVSKEFSRIIVSEYLRTLETAEYIAKSKGLTVERDKRLNEIDGGLLERLPKEEIEARFPDFWQAFTGHASDVRFPGGESGEEVKARQKDLLEELIERDEDVVLISHEGYIRLLLCHLLDLPVYKRYLFHVDFCGICELEHDKSKGEWTVLRINETPDR